MGDNAFKINNTDWILQSAINALGDKTTTAIFRMKSGTQYDMANTSILLGDGTDHSISTEHPLGHNASTGLNMDHFTMDLGAIFFQDAFKGTNEVFNLNNVILGGIGLWDFTDFNPNRSQLLNPANSVFSPPTGDQTMIFMNDAQGCAQFISHEINMQDNRWNRCFKGGDKVPEPGSAALLLLGLAGLAFRSGRRRLKADLMR